MNNNIAVIGHTSPSENIQKRERKIVSQLVKKEQVIVSGLAKGCDVIAHEECMRLGGKTIAILPSPINEVLPKEHTKQAKQMCIRDSRCICKGVLIMCLQWRFPDNGNGMEYGLETGDIDIFKKDPIGSLAREICQNSIDANRGVHPTRIEFSTFDVARNDIPGIDELRCV